MLRTSHWVFPASHRPGGGSGASLAPADREEAAHFEAFGHLDGDVRQADGVDRPFALAPAEERVVAVRDGLIDLWLQVFGDCFACLDVGSQLRVDLALQLHGDRCAIVALLVGQVLRKKPWNRRVDKCGAVLSKR